MVGTHNVAELRVLVRMSNNGRTPILQREVARHVDERPSMIHRDVHSAGPAGPHGAVPHQTDHQTGAVGRPVDHPRVVRVVKLRL